MEDLLSFPLLFIEQMLSQSSAVCSLLLIYIHFVHIKNLTYHNVTKVK